MGKPSMIQRMTAAFKALSVEAAVKKNSNTCKSLKDEIAEARAKADAEAIERERLERVGAGSPTGKEGA